MIIVLFVLGMALIIKGGDWFVDAASWMAEATGIPKFIVGATVVSLATTLPEVMVSVIAVLQGSNDLGIGNAVGSVSCNLGLGLAFSIFFAASSLKIDISDFGRKGVLMLLGALALLFLTLDGLLTPIKSIVLLIILITFIGINVISAKNGMEGHSKKTKGTTEHIFKNVFKFVVGAILIVVGARFMVDNGTEIARVLGVSETVIGLTLVAVGTSLPELTTAVTAMAKKESSMSVGNIIGANVIDLTLILPVCSFLSAEGLTVSEGTSRIDIPVAIVLILITVIPTIFAKKFKKWQGLTLFGVYIMYVILMVL